MKPDTFKDDADQSAVLDTAKYSTMALADGIVIGGPWPHTIIAWPHGSSRGATKPEHDLFQALERLKASHDRLLSALKAILEGLDTENKAAPWHVRDAESAIAQAEALEPKYGAGGDGGGGSLVGIGTNGK